jgi:hypothetical protein
MEKILFILVVASIPLFGQTLEDVPAGSNAVTIYGNTSGSTVSELKLASDGSQDVNVQDQTTDPIIFKFNKIAESTILSDTALVDGYTLIVDDTTGVANNNYVIVFNPDTERFYKGLMLSVSGDTLTMDTPLDSTFPDSSFVDFTSTNMNVDGSSTAQTFGVRGVSPSPVGITVDITRIILHCQTATAVDLAKFADITELSKGWVLRVRNGRNFNIFNVKTNGEMAALMYDWTPYLATNPQQGVDGFLGRLTFAGQSKIGVAVRLMPGEDLEFIIQDDLTDITLLEVTAEGHIVE